MVKAQAHNYINIKDEEEEIEGKREEQHELTFQKTNNVWDPDFVHCWITTFVFKFIQ